MTSKTSTTSTSSTTLLLSVPPRDPLLVRRPFRRQRLRGLHRFRSEALEQADRAILFKTGSKEIGSRYGIMPSFMAKWNQHLPGFPFQSTCRCPSACLPVTFPTGRCVPVFIAAWQTSARKTISEVDRRLDRGNNGAVPGGRTYATLTAKDQEPPLEPDLCNRLSAS